MEKDKQNKPKPPISLVNKVKSFLFGSKKRIVITVAILVVVGFLGFKNTLGKNNTPQYQTAQVAKGTIVTSVSESGSVAVANRVSVTTQASGVVNQIYVKNGDTVTTGEKIASLNLDRDGQQRQIQAWSSYLQAKNSLASANAQLYSLQSTMFAKWKIYTDLATNSTYQNSDSTPNTTNRVLTPFTTVQDDWLAAEAQYQNQQGTIAQTQAALNNAWLSYQAASPDILAPSAGTISDLTITPGMQISSTYANNSSNVASQTIATVKTSGTPVVTVSLSEIDAVSVKAGDKATINLDAFPNQTFTGKVIGINTAGIVSSGVTTYPASIQLDVPNDDILPNMSATANIITHVKNDVLSIPTTAVQTTGGQSTARVLQNGKITYVPVETGLASDTNTEITSGLTEGETVITSIVSSTNSSSSSPFGGLRFGGFGGGGGGGIRRGGGG